ncbi:hypothetical protein DL764_001029 [Monosporascus ibericus]|uniref:Uncharacterized protein n=1 Tax=Monosporascus ibericus TaxID=155417 RepID=A0A4Q4TR97_9PEZI|nr:hypothetical protein DL764_001029 [Monosporascus ibericus]
MARTTQETNKANIDREDAMKLEETRKQFRVEKEERLLASIRTMDNLFARVRGDADTEAQGRQLWRDAVEYWNKNVPEGVRPSSASKSTPYQEDPESLMMPRIYDEEDLESSSHIRAPVNARQTYLSDRLNPLRRSSQPSVRGFYNTGYGLAERRLPHRPSTDVLELSGEAEAEAAVTPFPSTKYQISQQTLSDDFRLSRPYSGSREAEGKQTQPVLTILRTTTRVYQVHRVTPTQSRGSAHRRGYDSEQAPTPSYSSFQREYHRVASTHWRDYDFERAPQPSCSDLQRTGTREYSRAQTTNEDWQAQGSSSPDFNQGCRYQTRKPHGWYEDWVAETTGEEAKGLQHGSSASVTLYSYGNQARPSGAKRSRSWDDDGEEETRDEDAINDENDGIGTPACSRITFASRKRLRLS